MPDQWDAYIDVIGEGKYVEEVEAYVADVILDVRAATDETSGREVAELRDRCVKTLVASGLGYDEITDGGGEVGQSWYRRKQPARHALHKLTIKTPDQHRLAKALGELEPLFSNQRHEFVVKMRQPVFADDLSVSLQAQREAVAQARVKAEVLAQEAGVTLGDIRRVEEGGRSRRASGAFGDDDWWGDDQRFGSAGPALAGATATEDPLPTETPKRTIWVRCRVRFVIEPAAAKHHGHMAA